MFSYRQAFGLFKREQMKIVKTIKFYEIWHYRKYSLENALSFYGQNR